MTFMEYISYTFAFSIYDLSILRFYSIFHDSSLLQLHAMNSVFYHDSLWIQHALNWNTRNLIASATTFIHLLLSFYVIWLSWLKLVIHFMLFDFLLIFFSLIKIKGTPNGEERGLVFCSEESFCFWFQKGTGLWITCVTLPLTWMEENYPEIR